MIFEEMLFDGEKGFRSDFSSNIDFIIDRILLMPKYRPFLLSEVVDLCLLYLGFLDFKEKLLFHAVHECPVLIRRLYIKGAYNFSDLGRFVKGPGLSFFQFYFHDTISGFEERLQNIEYFDKYFHQIVQNKNDLNNLIEYGFLPSMIEYSLKYDDHEKINDYFTVSNTNKEISLIWSPFEWAMKPTSLDPLSFSGIFGSIKCFRLFLIRGYKFNKSIIQNVVMGGSIEIFHLCPLNKDYFKSLLYNASKCCHFHLVLYFMEQMSNENRKDIDMLFKLY